MTEPNAAVVAIEKPKMPVLGGKKKRRRKKIIIIAIVAAVVIAAAVAWVTIKSFAVAPSDPDAVFSGDQVQVERDNLNKTVSLSGSVASQTEAAVSTSIQGNVKRLTVAVGDHVTAGQTVAVMDTSELEKELRTQSQAAAAARAAQAKQVAQARQAYVDAVNDLNRGQNLDVLTARAALQKATNERIEAQRVATASPSEENTAAKNDAVNAEKDAQNQLNIANVTAKQKVRELLRAWQGAGNEGADDASAALAGLRDQIAHATLTAPVNGVVASVNVKAGQPAGGPILTIVDDKSFLLHAAVKEADVNKIKAGQRVTFTTPATGKKEFHGTVETLSPVAASAPAAPADAPMGGILGNGDNSGGSEVNFPLQVKVSGTPKNLRVGSSAKIKIEIESHPHVLVVPKSAVTMNPNDTSANPSMVVLTVKGSAPIRALPVETVAESGSSVAIKGKDVKVGLQVLQNADSYLHLIGRAPKWTDTPSDTGEGVL